MSLWYVYLYIWKWISIIPQCLVNQKYIIMAVQMMQISRQDSQQTNVVNKISFVISVYYVQSQCTKVKKIEFSQYIDKSIIYNSITNNLLIF